MQIRPFQPGDEPALYAVFHSAIHDVACRDYTPAQLHAWSPGNLDPALWQQRMRGINPFVVEAEGAIVAYADVQPDGLIDHFFVSGQFQGRGAGRLLMTHLVATARGRQTQQLHSLVSRTAQGFFEHFGFAVVEQRAEAVRGVVVPNARMTRALNATDFVGAVLPRL